MKGRVLHYIWSLMLFTLMLPGIIRTDQEGAANPLQEKLSEQTDLPTLIQLAYERNPRIESARTEWQAAVEKLPQITSLPDPMLMYGYFLRNVETRVGPQRHRLSFPNLSPIPGH